jgi:serine/threonine protein kinase
MAEMFTGKPLFPGKNSVDQLAKIVKVLGPPTPEDLVAMGQQARKTANINKPSLSPEQTRRLLEESFLTQGIPVSAVDLLLEMLRYDPIKRIKATDSLNHPFFSTMANPPKIDGPVPVISHTTPNSSRRHYKSGPQPS